MVPWWVFPSVVFVPFVIGFGGAYLIGLPEKNLPCKYCHGTCRLYACVTDVNGVEELRCPHCWGRIA